MRQMRASVRSDGTAPRRSDPSIAQKQPWHITHLEDSDIGQVANL
jgi:hypothetical protein